ncbi:SDR family NAD(P)-dependent oxidoreductase [Novosphingobium sp. BK486]|uniref:SDR family NAD(P)-dependent oxidoreductase n=1 Tax=unclassified Novosphingobium TaxID=2644732 RepID=UPI0017E82B3E|nr:3(or 17)beta-hydroxysteroid dehydrogenase [Novosphingobium sp. BK256]MBB3374427.1 3(or 17)beta-hydroxysteroid dehydrogenase [Novosphingobium sp. BK280]MBB3378839.1 3(or 17)beta-hydroxysteroid dehydrogenase [Novosphingobium sp. BK258]MBB3420533.1 3(or 17)beta-hydroxysteroid dehydrogenase [Novosphingobium sp. BK267]MBB3448345.1 3(or 17)beta-hydroxysteroid dehydrogenase [Novosphingobium sp. BK352]MBB3477750.1 3(or 17)beta-hydroxysteroid dehydrogenase [Novosphingobium sp. BK369]MBB3501059.1 3(
MSRRLEGKVALVTGGTSGIGAGVVRRLAAEGAKVVFTGSRAELGEALAQEVGGRFASHRVEDAAAWPGLIESLLAEHGRLDIAFANAGTEQGDANIEDVTIEGWSKIVAINQTGVMLTVQHAIRAMARNQGATGSIIINSSMNAARPLGNYVTYSTTKAAVVALAKSAAVYCGQKRYRIRVNAILPGVVETDLIRAIMESQPDPAAVRAIYEGMAPMNRMAQVEEVAGLVAYLASDEASFISGAELTIDGATTAGMMGV